MGSRVLKVTVAKRSHRNLQGYGYELLRLLMQGTLVIFRAEFRVFHSSRLFTLVLCGRVIPHFADGTLECDNVSHDMFLKLKKRLLFEFIRSCGYLALLAFDIIQYDGRHELEPTAARADIRRYRHCAPEIKL